MSKFKKEDEHLSEMEKDVNSLIKFIDVLDHPNLNLKMVKELTKKAKNFAKNMNKKYNKDLDIEK